MGSTNGIAPGTVTVFGKKSLKIFMLTWNDALQMLRIRLQTTFNSRILRKMQSVLLTQAAVAREHRTGCHDSQPKPNLSGYSNRIRTL